MQVDTCTTFHFRGTAIYAATHLDVKRGTNNLHADTIALPTAVALLTLCVGLLLVRPTEDLMRQVMADDPGGANLRRWLPVVLLPFVLDPKVPYQLSGQFLL